MEVIVDTAYTKYASQSKSSELVITIISVSVLHAWQMLQNERNQCKIHASNANHITWINKEVEKQPGTPYLLHYRKDRANKQEYIWLQTLTSLPENYLNIHLKPTI